MKTLSVREASFSRQGSHSWFPKYSNATFREDYPSN